MNISSYIRAGKNVITANSPVLLVGTAIAGVVTTGILSARAGYQARGLVDEAEEKKGDILTTQEKFQLTWLCYTAPAVTGVSTIASVVGLHTIHTKRFNAMAGLYAVTTTKLDEYAANAEELLGGKKTQDLNNRIAQNNVDSVPVGDDREIYLMGDEGKELCQDGMTGRWFMGSLATINLAVAKLNTMIAKHGEATLNDFYVELGVPEIQAAPVSELGWKRDALEGSDVEVRFGDARTHDGRPAISFWFHTKPAVL